LRQSRFLSQQAKHFIDFMDSVYGGAEELSKKVVQTSIAFSAQTGEDLEEDGNPF
jgi:hypothetical protein